MFIVTVITAEEEPEAFMFAACAASKEEAEKLATLGIKVPISTVVTRPLPSSLPTQEGEVAYL